MIRISSSLLLPLHTGIALCCSVSINDYLNDNFDLMDDHERSFSSVDENGQCLKLFKITNFQDSELSSRRLDIIKMYSNNVCNESCKIELDGRFEEEVKKTNCDDTKNKI